MDDSTLAVLEYGKIKAIVARWVQTGPGRAALAAVKPSSDAVAAQRLLDETEEMRAAFGGRGLPLAQVATLSDLLRQAREAGLLEPDELASLATTVRAAEGARRTLLDAAGGAAAALAGSGVPRSDAGNGDGHGDARAPSAGEGARSAAANLPRLLDLARRIPVLPGLASSIEEAIGPDGAVRDDASPELAEIRWRIADAEAAILSSLAAILREPEVAKVLRNDRPSIRNGRYVLAVRTDARTAVPGVILDRSQTEKTVFIEPHAIVAPGNDLDDLRAEERREVFRILRELTRSCLEQELELLRVEDALAAVDLASARARWAVAWGLVAPRLDPPESPLELRDARHPLLIAQAEDGRLPSGTVTPIDVRLGESFDVLLITGPNTGGKTVALKTVGILAALAQSGFPIPAAAGSRLPIYERIFTDIGDEQSLEQSLSTFSSHIARLVPILEKAGPRDLVLIDELGSGTDPAEGTALGIAIVEAVLDRGTRALVTTHLGRLKALAFERARIENAACEFDPRSLRPTYRLLLGQAGASQAFRICERLGLPARVLERAREIGDADGLAGQGAEVEAIAELRLVAEARLADADRVRAEVEERLAEAAGERERLAARERILDAEADRDIDERFAVIEREVDVGCRALLTAPAPYADRARDLARKVAELLERSPFGERRRAFARCLSPGETVWVIPLGRRGTVVKVNRAKERLAVQMDGLRTQVPFRDVSWVEPASS